MKKGKIITQKIEKHTADIKWEFYIDFKDSRFWPYTHIFERKRLYFNEGVEERGSYFFPLRSGKFKNTEIFLETNDIVVWIGERGSFSGQAKRFLEIVNLKTKQKYRFYPDEVSLIYNTQDEIVLYYKKSEKYKKLTLSKTMLEKLSEKSQQTDAFFKLLYNWDDKKYIRLIYHANSSSHQAGYFSEELLENEKKITQDIKWLNMAYLEEPDGKFRAPKKFHREKFELITTSHQKIDVWETSLSWIISR